MPMNRTCSPVSMTMGSPSMTWVTTDVAAGGTGATVVAGARVGGGGDGVVGGGVGRTVCATVVATAVVGPSVVGVVEVAGATVDVGGSVLAAAAAVSAL